MTGCGVSWDMSVTPLDIPGLSENPAAAMLSENANSESEFIVEANCHLENKSTSRKGSYNRG